MAVLALALGGYFASVAFGGNGFVAAFVAGLAFGGATRQSEGRAELFSETAGILLSIGVWTVFGAVFVGSLFRDLNDVRPILYAMLSLTVIRMVPVAIALIGSRLALPTVAFIGWFGPRGLASIVFGILAIDALTEAGARRPHALGHRGLDGPALGRGPRLHSRPTRGTLRPMDRCAPRSRGSTDAGVQRARRTPSGTAVGLGPAQRADRTWRGTRRLTALRARRGPVQPAPTAAAETATFGALGSSVGQLEADLLVDAALALVPVTRIAPTSLVLATCVPPSAWRSRPTMSIVRTSAIPDGSRLILVRIRSGIANASSRGRIATLISRSAAISALTRASIAPTSSPDIRLELEVHPGRARLHVAAGDLRAEIAPDDAAQDVQRGVRPHQR